ncbi:MAG: methyltransferase, TIGR04325 family [Bdellovibrionota bacterium]
MDLNNKYIWEGTYKSFSECPGAGKGYEATSASQRYVDQLKKFLLDNSSLEKDIILKRHRDNHLPVLVATLQAQLSRPIRILDFGGGIGFTYAVLSQCLTDSANIDYTILDTEEVCKAGADVFKNNKNLKFVKSISEINVNTNYDVIHFGSSIHYVEKWKELISKLNGFSPKFFLFTDFLGGSFEDFVTTQNYYESKIPVWFFNLNNFKSFFKDIGYNFSFQSTYHPTIFGKEQDMPMDNFPEDQRLKNSVNILFCKKPENK